MQKNLVIVESPAKAKTIGKFLGDDYKVMSSYGHIRDLKKKEFSIDIKNKFEPEYEIPTDKKKVVAELKSEAEHSDTVWLASDEDREGEAISWHLYEVLGLDPQHTKRIVFHEITKPAIESAIQHPRDIDINLVNAQQARRVLDRIVGFELSPVLWRKVKPALSAGRVQSVAVRLIVDREREINAFKVEPWYRVTAVLSVLGQDGETHEVRAESPKRYASKEEAGEFLRQCAAAQFRVEDITTKPLTKYPAPPFTTSTLQQEAARKLGFSVSQTMTVAQRLYESGHITYMRTDSVNLSELALAAARKEIIDLVGERYVKTRHFTTKTKGAQEAHEAIRPTYMDKLEIEGTPQEKKLYELIWKRTIASQMAEAVIEKTTVTIGLDNSDGKLVASGEVVKFDGFLRVHVESSDDADTSSEDVRMLPPIDKNDVVNYEKVTATERFTQPPLRYTEASLVKKLEELGIGRPSTYAPTISTIQQREYVVKGDHPGATRKYEVETLENGEIKEETKEETVGNERGKLIPTDIGLVVNDYLTQSFPEILDYNFTASIEKQFDEVAEGHKDWKELMAQFYTPFQESVDAAKATKTEHKVGERMLGIDPATGRPVSVKIGRFGPIAQIGTNEDETKPRFASLRKGQSLETITLEEALELFRLPRVLGAFEERAVTVAMGRFGPYVRHDSKFYSIPKDIDPLEITLDEAKKLIVDKRESDAKKLIRKFDCEPAMEILNGRYGPYISYDKKNYKIPKTVVPEELDYDACIKIVQEEDAKPPTARRGRFARKKA